MILLLLSACEAPGTLASVSALLAEDVVAVGEPPIRTVTAIAGIVAETCGVGEVEDHLFASRSAVAFGAELATVVRDSSAQTWTFTGVGLDGADGTLVLETDASQENFAVTYDGPGVELSAGIELRACDDAATAATVGGTGTWTGAGPEVALTLLDAARGLGLSFTPPAADLPGGGQVRAVDETDGWTILLDDASTVPGGSETWPGVASGADFTTDIAVRWP